MEVDDTNFSQLGLDHVNFYGIISLYLHPKNNQKWSMLFLYELDAVFFLCDDSTCRFIREFSQFDHLSKLALNNNLHDQYISVLKKIGIDDEELFSSVIRATNKFNE